MIYQPIALLEQRIATRLSGRPPNLSGTQAAGRGLTTRASAPRKRRSWTGHVFEKLVRIGTVYRRKRQLRRDAAYLYALDDYLLRDIGLARYEIEAAVKGHIARDRLTGDVPDASPQPS
jgi:uncharacterized protein YjiS (DUF1127 family)